MLQHDKRFTKLTYHGSYKIPRQMWIQSIYKRNQIPAKDLWLAL